ncbi:MAG: kinase/pyrophosphorylase [Myxococcales bacterium]|nr:kinase/pyrophosphorylase [Myxococcales bacterium]
MTKRSVFIVSDATGNTAERVVAAALKQFDASSVVAETFSHVRREQLIRDIIERAAGQEALVVHTMVDAAQRATIQQLCAEAGVKEVDLIGRLVAELAVLTSHEARMEPGGLHEVDDEYYRRIEAVEFAVRNDDGQHPRNLRKADIVLVGISRTSKTPLSTYLAQRGYKVANVPLVLGIELPAELKKIDSVRIFGLAIDPDALFRIRQARLQTLGMPADTAYGMRDHIDKEMEYARQVFDAHPDWPVIDVTDKAIEETAAELLALRKQRLR